MPSDSACSCMGVASQKFHQDYFSRFGWCPRKPRNLITLGNLYPYGIIHRKKQCIIITFHSTSTFLLISAYHRLVHIITFCCTSTGLSSQPNDSNSVRLYSGSSIQRNYGQVQIKQCSSQRNGECVWETVTATGIDREFWSWKNSQVVCRQLGYLGVQNPILSTRLATHDVVYEY